MPLQEKITSDFKKKAKFIDPFHDEFKKKKKAPTDIKQIVR